MSEASAPTGELEIAHDNLLDAAHELADHLAFGCAVTGVMTCAYEDAVTAAASRFVSVARARRLTALTAPTSEVDA